MAKLPRISDNSPRVSKRDYDRSNIDTLLESLFSVSDSALIDASFDGLVESRSTDSDQNDLVQRAFHIASVINEAGNRFVRKRSSVHNATVWPLPRDLTIKVFSILDTPSVCSAAATCLFFQKCATDPFCYANIDMATSLPDFIVPKINDVVVSTVIQRAGNTLQSLKLGVVLHDGFATRRMQQESLLTNSCLRYLSASDGALGSRLRRLHMHNICEIDNIGLSASLSVCPSLIDLEVVALNIEVSPTLELVSRFCSLLERFIYRSKGGKDDILETSVCQKFVLNCPKITTLAVKRCLVYDYDARELIKGFRELKFVEFSYSCCFTGAFLKNLGTKGGANNLEVMILRDCLDLDKVEVKKFMKALIQGKFRLLRHLDISNIFGLLYNGSRKRRRFDMSFIPIEKLLEKRPNFCLIAELPEKYSWDTSDSSSNSSCSDSEDSEESNFTDSEDTSD